MAALSELSCSLGLSLRCQGFHVVVLSLGKAGCVEISPDNTATVTGFESLFHVIFFTILQIWNWKVVFEAFLAWQWNKWNLHPRPSISNLESSHWAEVGKNCSFLGSLIAADLHSTAPTASVRLYQNVTNVIQAEEALLERTPRVAAPGENSCRAGFTQRAVCGAFLCSMLRTRFTLGGILVVSLLCFVLCVVAK